MAGRASTAEGTGNPRRIKVAHRWRWKCSTGHNVYANNNPVRFIDPDGLCSKSDTAATCIEASHAANPAGGNVKLSPTDEKFASSRSTRMAMATHGHGQEKIKAITTDSSGKPELTNLSNATASTDYSGNNAGGTLPAGAHAVIHSHVHNSLTDKPGLGDSRVPILNHLPNVTVSGDGRRAGVHEIDNGKVQFRMIHGKMTSGEQKHMLDHLNQAQDVYDSLDQ